MGAADDFNANCDAHAETLTMLGMEDAVRGLRLAQREALIAINAAIPEAQAPASAPRTRNVSPEERARRSKFAREVLIPKMMAARAARRTAAAEPAQG